jgi:hypothetical protein
MKPCDGKLSLFRARERRSVLPDPQPDWVSRRGDTSARRAKLAPHDARGTARPGARRAPQRVLPFRFSVTDGVDAYNAYTRSGQMAESGACSIAGHPASARVVVTTSASRIAPRLPSHPNADGTVREAVRRQGAYDASHLGVSGRRDVLRISLVDHLWARQRARAAPPLILALGAPHAVAIAAPVGLAGNLAKVVVMRAHVDRRALLLLMTGAVPGAAVGAFSVGVIPAAWLQRGLGVWLSGYAALAAWRRPKEAPAGEASRTARQRFPDAAAGEPRRAGFETRHHRMLIAYGAVTGVMSGALGVGGGSPGPACVATVSQSRRSSRLWASYRSPCS